VESLPALRLAFLRTKAPVIFGALDDRPVDLFFALAGPPRERREYLAALATLSYLFRSDEVRRKFREVDTAEGAVELFGRLSATAHPE
jgi:mannitol/fructose-specific phosphotransferase system IIA component (Ntr-type)